jgi:hypothetical protein
MLKIYNSNKLLFLVDTYIQRVSEISALILTSDRARQDQQNCYASFFRNIISVF